MVANGISVVQVNPYAVKQTKEVEDNSQLKDDTKDPKLIANLVKDGNFGMPYLPEKLYADIRRLSMFRDQLNEDRIRNLNRLHREMKIYFPEYKDAFGKVDGAFCLEILKVAPFPAELVVLGTEGIKQIWHDAKLRGRGYANATSILEYAVWKINQYTVKFDKNGGKVSHPQEKFEHSKKLGKLPTSKRAKYTFAGWYTAKRGGELVTSNTVVKNNMTLYAHWKKVTVHKTKVISKRTTKKYIYVNVKKVTGAAGYELKCYRNGKLYRTVQKRSEKLSVVASKKGRYLIRVRAFKKDSMDNKVYGMYSSGINIIK